MWRDVGRRRLFLIDIQKCLPYYPRCSYQFAATHTGAGAAAVEKRPVGEHHVAAKGDRETNRWDESEYEMEAPAGVSWVHFGRTRRPDWISKMGRHGYAERSCPRRS